MKLTLLLRNAVTALNTMHVRGDEAKVFSGSIDAISAVIRALEQAEKEIGSTNEQKEEPQ